MRDATAIIEQSGERIDMRKLIVAIGKKMREDALVESLKSRPVGEER